mmetsp:Transcript_13401/g.14551  ORF Transcript_13401/g.14551 Transcript_13401/m.14551 type:complete len:222 (+) Transcript_13401:397-1062(+)
MSGASSIAYFSSPVSSTCPSPLDRRIVRDNFILTSAPIITGSLSSPTASPLPLLVSICKFNDRDEELPSPPEVNDKDGVVDSLCWDCFATLFLNCCAANCSTSSSSLSSSVINNSGCCNNNIASNVPQSLPSIINVRPLCGLLGSIIHSSKETISSVIFSIFLGSDWCFDSCSCCSFSFFACSFAAFLLPFVVTALLSAACAALLSVVLTVVISSVIWRIL